MVSRVTYTDKYCTCIWTSTGEFRYEQDDSVYVTLLNKCILILIQIYSMKGLFAKYIVIS